LRKSRDWIGYFPYTRSKNAPAEDRADLSVVTGAGAPARLSENELAAHL
jgi:hypothetical protein